jgi:hypothetical protein
MSYSVRGIIMAADAICYILYEQYNSRTESDKPAMSMEH